MPPLAIAGAGLGVSALGSFLSGRPKTTTQTQTTTPTFSPELQALMSQLQNYSTSSIANPQASFGPIRAAGIDQVNRNYTDVPQQLTQQLSRRGYGSSGALGNTMYRTGLARAGDLSTLEGQLATAGINRQQQGATLGAQLLGLGRGSSSTGTQTTPNTSWSNALGSAGSGLFDLGTLLQFGNMGRDPSFQRYGNAPAFDPSSITPGIPGYQNQLPPPPNIDQYGGKYPNPYGF